MSSVYQVLVLSEVNVRMGWKCPLATGLSITPISTVEAELSIRKRICMERWRTESTSRSGKMAVG